MILYALLSSFHLESFTAAVLRMMASDHLNQKQHSRKNLFAPLSICKKKKKKKKRISTLMRCLP